MGKSILFDLESTQPSVSGKRHGGGIYGEVLFRKLIELGADMAAYYNSDKWLNPDIRNVAELNNIALHDVKGRTVNDIVSEMKPRVFYSPILEDFRFDDDVTVMGTLHGLRHLELPRDPLMGRYSGIPMTQRIKNFVRPLAPGLILKYNKRRFYSFQLDKDFVVVSDHTAHSLKQFFPETAGRDVKVFYSPSTTVEMELDKARTAEYPYFLMVSGNRWEKNVLRAIMAFERLFDAGLLADYKVHITGLRALSDLRYRYRHPDRFVALGYVDDAELQRQYRDCYGFIYPSLNEGFGYPPVEAMRFGVPVAVSAVCSIPEVCGDAALYFNPMDVPEIGNRILQLTDPKIRERLHEASLNRYKVITERQNNDLEQLARYIIDKSRR
ncbi:MAG: glycosyltransferase [Muribaculaceae bacterium]|nr:glycosyltransferase [Muribaculaceae bacterium]